MLQHYLSDPRLPFLSREVFRVGEKESKSYRFDLGIVEHFEYSLSEVNSDEVVG